MRNDDARDAVAGALRPRRQRHAGAVSRTARSSSMCRRWAARIPTIPRFCSRDRPSATNSSSSSATRARRRLPRLASHAAIAWPCCCRTVRNSSSSSSRRVEDRCDRRAAQSALYRGRTRDGASRERRDGIAVGLTRFYHRIKNVQPSTAVRHVVATNIKDHFPPMLKTPVYARSREARRRSRLADGGRSRSAVAPDRHAGARPARVRSRPRSSRTSDERRHDRNAEGGAGNARSRLQRHRQADHALERIAVLRGPEDVCFVPLPLFHVYVNVGMQAVAFVNGARWRWSQPARFGRICSRRSARQAGVLLRRADAVRRDHQSCRRAATERSTSSRFASAFPARPRFSRTRNAVSRRSPAAASSKAIR